MENQITSGNILKAMRGFAIPYLIASFLQSFYGMADLFITGQFNGAAVVTAVSIGSQVMHMVTVIIVGLAMGTTVAISHSVGAEDKNRAAHYIGNSICVFAGFAIVLTVILLALVSPVMAVLQTPEESLIETGHYLFICFIGIIFITAYNVISSIFRGIGDTKSPMIFVAVAGVINIVLDYVLIGGFHLGAAGAAIATIAAQALSVVMALVAIRRKSIGIHLEKKHFHPKKRYMTQIMKIGAPISCQDGIIQVSFLVITMIANGRGLAVATAVGIVEKIISFLFLVPSAMLSTVSAMAAQNAGAGRHDRGRLVLRYGITLCVGFGLLVCMLCQFVSPQLVGLFVKDEPEIIKLGTQYLRTYSLDCAIAGIHFCFSGYFSAYGKSIYSFVHNLFSALVIRIPGTYLASVLFPATLLPMGLAAPTGSLVSTLICYMLYRKMQAEKFSRK